MKNTGIVRPIDSLGRITIPAELRREMKITQDSMLEIYQEGEKVIIQVKR